LGNQKAIDRRRKEITMAKRKRISKLPKNDIQTTKDWAKRTPGFNSVVPEGSVDSAQLVLPVVLLLRDTSIM
jgi:hypothetical protein